MPDRRRWLLLVVLVSLLPAACRQAATPPPPGAQAGFLDLRGRPISDETPLIPLFGEWQFVWEELLSPAEIFDRPAPGFVPVPANWTDYGPDITTEGYATFALKLALPETADTYGLYIDGEGMAYTLWLDGEIVARNGVVGVNKAGTVAEKLPLVAFFRPAGPETTLVMQIANYHHRNAGFQNELLLGTARAVHQYQLRRWLVNVLPLAVYFIIGLYHLGLFFFRPQNRSPLYFALVCWLVAVRIGVSDQNLLLVLWPSISWELQLRIEYLTFYWSLFTLVLFFSSLYPQDIAPLFLRVSAVLAGVYSLYLLNPDTLAVSKTIASYQVILLLQVLYLPYAFGRILYYRRPEALLVGLAALIMISAAVVDILRSVGVIVPGGPFEETAPLAFMIFIFLQAVLLSLRFSRAYHTIGQMQVSLHNSERKYRNVFEESLDMIFLAGLDGQILDVSPVCTRLLGYSREVLQGMNVFDLLADQGQMAQVQAILTQQATIQDFETQIVRRDGQTIDVSVSAVLRRNDADVVTGVQGIVRDITDKKQAEAERLRALEMERAKELAEAANEAKSTFLSNMSHELRSPLNAILGFAQVIRRGQNLDPEHREQLGIIQRSGEHLLALINQVLDLAKIEAGRITLNGKDFDLHRLLDDLEDMFSLKADDKRLWLNFNCPPDVPQYIHTDEVKLRQVLINLLNNALKFTERGEVSLRTTVVAVADQPDVTIQFEVSDTGPGIPPQDVDSLFEAFVQTELGRQAQEGTGLGLPISRSFVQLMGGDLNVRSQVGQGTTFYFTITAPAVDEAQFSARQPERQVVALAPDQPRYRILVVDDKWANRQLLVKLLEPLGFDLREATNGQEAVAVWEEWAPQLIWMDMRMPVMDGYMATQQIKATVKGQATAVIALTASTLEEERAIVLSAGCDDFMRKPFREAEIFQALAKHIGVEFIYNEPAADGAPAGGPATPRLSAGDLAPLPADLLANLRQAALLAHMTQVDEVIGAVGAHDADVAVALGRLAHDFQYGVIIDLIDAVQGRGGGAAGADER